MDKFEVFGYSIAGVCLLGTVAVFFLWIMPSNQAMTADLGKIKTQAGKLQQLRTNTETALTGDSAKPDDLQGVTSITKNLIATDEVKAAAKKARSILATRTDELIKHVIADHEVEAKPIPTDRVRDAQRIRQELQKLYDDKGVAFAGAGAYGLSPDGALSVDENTYRTFVLFQEVSAAVLDAKTNVKWTKPTVDGFSGALNPLSEPTDEKVTAIEKFAYFNADQWGNLEKKYRDENARAAKQAMTAAPVIPDNDPLGYTKEGFRITFRTNPVNVNAALMSFEKLGKALVTVRRLEVIRAGLPVYTPSDIAKGGIPLPFRDGDVQVTAEVEVLRFKPKSAEAMNEKLFKDQ